MATRYIYLSEELNNKLKEEENASALIQSLLLKHFNFAKRTPEEALKELETLENKRAPLIAVLNEEEEKLRIDSEEAEKEGLEKEKKEREEFLQREKDRQEWKDTPEEEKQRLIESRSLWALNQAAINKEEDPERLLF